MAKRTKAAKRRKAPARVPVPAPPPAPSPDIPVATTPPGSASTVRARFYCQGIGDCHLLRFTKTDRSFFWMLIDCGVHSSVTGGSDTIRAIVDDIFSVTHRIDVLVLTHEHWDHNSGFLSAQEKFKQFEVGEIWLGWTENAADPQARTLDKFKGDALTALQGARQRLDKASALSPHLATVRDGLDQVLGFMFGAKGEKVRSARDAAIALANGRIKYWEPSSVPFKLANDVPNVRVYVLGPPRDDALLRVTTRPSEMYGMAGAPVALALNHAFAMDDGPTQVWNDAAAPFDPSEGFVLSKLLAPAEVKPTRTKDSRDDPTAVDVAALIRDRYTGPAPQAGTTAAASDQSWRRIDHDWLGVSADLAIQLDKLTNNSSLVLALEFVDTRRVLLFVGDAQVGNWLSWEGVKWTVGNTATSAHDLLARTVFYKVGHHGSENATIKQKGLELMVHPDLCAFIPTNKEDAKKVGWGEMPFGPLLEALDRRASDRVIRGDDPWIKRSDGQPSFSTTSGAMKLHDHDKQRGLWIELDIG